jgi:hypothetical protein
MPILLEEDEYESLLLSLLNLYPNNHLLLFTSLIPVYQSNFFFHVYSKLKKLSCDNNSINNDDNTELCIYKQHNQATNYIHDKHHMNDT